MTLAKAVPSVSLAKGVVRGAALTLFSFIGCGGPGMTSQQMPMLTFQLAVDPTQVRLNNFGQPAMVAAGDAAQTPQFDKIAISYIELSPSALTPLGMGAVAYVAKTTTAGGMPATDFSQLNLVMPPGTTYATGIDSVPAGTYEYLRVAVSYQEYDVTGQASGYNFSGRIASFVDALTYSSTYTLNGTMVTVNANKPQGYYGFQTAYLPGVMQGQAPATTVVNPIAATSPIPANSCIFTAAFAQPLTLTGNDGLTITASFSTNQSFEWKDVNGDGIWEPTAGEYVVDMGLRGMVATYQ